MKVTLSPKTNVKSKTNEMEVQNESDSVKPKTIEMELPNESDSVQSKQMN